MAGEREGNEADARRESGDGDAGPSGDVAGSSDNEEGVERLLPDSDEDEDSDKDDDDDRESLGGHATVDGGDGEGEEWEPELTAEWNLVRRAALEPPTPAFDWDVFPFQAEPHGVGAPKHWAQWVEQSLPMPDVPYGCEGRIYSEEEGITELGKTALLKAMNLVGEPWNANTVKEKVMAVDVWALLMPDELIDKVVEETNRQYHFILSQPKPNTIRGGRDWPPKWTEKWTPVTRDEMKLFFGIMYAYGLSKCCGIRKFFSRINRASYCRPPVCDMMSRDRFTAIKACLHFRSEHHPLAPGELRKMGNMLESFEKQCKEVFRAGANVALDEMMIRFEGNFAFVHRKQHKPTNEGMKMYAIADSATGYTICFMLDRRDGKTKVEDFVRSLAARLPGDWQEIFMDNLFTSSSILKELHDMKKFATGTVRAARRGYPADLAATAVAWDKTCPAQGSYAIRMAPQSVQPDPTQLRPPSSTQYAPVVRSTVTTVTWRLSNYLWMDSGPAKLMSNRWGAEMGTLERRVKGHANRQPIIAPLAFVLYNKYMGAVDIADALRSYMTTAAVTNKWYIAIWYWIMDVAAVNAWIIYYRLKGFTDKQKARGRADFQDELIAGLTGWSGDGNEVEDAPAAPRKRRVAGMKRKGTVVSLVPRYNRKKPPPCRKHNVHHWPKETREYRNCVYCWSLTNSVRKETTVACEYCGVYLCSKHFKKFHM